MSEDKDRGPSEADINFRAPDASRDAAAGRKYNNLTFAKRTGKVMLDARTYLVEALGVTEASLDEPYRTSFEMGDTRMVAQYLASELRRWQQEKKACLDRDTVTQQEELGSIESIIHFLEDALGMESSG